MKYVPFYYTKEVRTIGKRKTNEEFIQQLAEIHPDIKTLETYVDSRIKMKFKCLICEHMWNATPANVLRSKGCPECSKRANVLDREEFLMRTKEMCPNIKLLTQYTKATDDYLCECIICGHQWSANGSNILRGKAGCKECDRKDRRLTHNEFLTKLNNITNDLVPLDEYHDIYIQKFVKIRHQVVFYI